MRQVVASNATANAVSTPESDVPRLLPPGARLVPIDGQPYLRADLGGGGTMDVVVAYAVGGTHPRLAGALVAAPTPGGGLRTLWASSPGKTGAYGVDQVAIADFTGAGRPQVLVALDAGDTFSTVTVVGFDGSTPHVLLQRTGGRVTVIPHDDGGGLPGIALWTHDTGEAGPTGVWQWSAALGAFARADTAFRSYYSGTVVPFDRRHLLSGAWSYYYLAQDQVKAGDYAAVLATAQKGFDGFGNTYMSGSPAFYVVEGDAYRGLGRCDSAIPLYRRALAGAPSGMSGDAPTASAYFGIAACLRADGQPAAAAAEFRRALAGGPQNGDWNGYAAARAAVRA